MAHGRISKYIFLKFNSFLAGKNSDNQSSSEWLKISNKKELALVKENDGEFWLI